MLIRRTPRSAIGEAQARPHHHNVDRLGRNGFHQLRDIVPVPRTGGIETVRAGIGEGDEFFDGWLQGCRVQKQPLRTRDED